MVTVSLKQARLRLEELISQANKGEVIAITRRGKCVARLVPADRKPKRLPSMAAFRASLKAKGVRVSESVVEKMREEERY